MAVNFQPQKVMMFARTLNVANEQFIQLNIIYLPRNCPNKTNYINQLYKCLTDCSQRI